MATVQYFDVLGPTQALELVGNSGLLPLDALGSAYPNTSSTYEDDGGRIQQLIYSGGVLRLRYDYTYGTVVTPYADKIISQVNVYGSGDEPIQRWSGLSISLASVIASNALPVLQGEDQIEGNASSNVLQGALGDDLLFGRAGADTFHGGRADDTLVGGPGDDTLYGGLGTDSAAFYGPAANYRWALNADGSIAISESGTSANDGADRLYDVEWLVFNYGTANQAAVRTSKLIHNETSVIAGTRTFDPLDPNVIPPDSSIISDGRAWTFKQNTQTIGWAIANNGALAWPDIQRMQDIIGDALEEVSKTANLNFTFYGAHTSVASATAGGADFVYTLGSASKAGDVAWAFFPGSTDRTIDFNSALITAHWNSPNFAAYYKFVTIHETGHTLGLKHPHHPGFRNATTVAWDVIDQFATVMSYYNPTESGLMDGFYPETPMALDALSLNAIYGASSYRDGLGNTIHALLSRKTYQTIVDFDGTNTLDARAAAEGWVIALDDSGIDYTIAKPLSGVFPSSQVVLGMGIFSNAFGSQYDDAISGTALKNVINAGPGNDMVLSLGGGDEISGGEGFDTLLLEEPVSALAFTNRAGGGIDLKKSGALVASVTGFEPYRFGYGSAVSQDISAAELAKRIQDSPATMTATLSGAALEDQRLAVKVTISDVDGVKPFAIQWQPSSEAGVWVVIAGQASDSISLTQAEVGKTQRAKITRTDLLGNTQVGFSNVSATAQNVNDSPAGSVLIQSSADPGTTLTADATGLPDEDGLGPPIYQQSQSFAPHGGLPVSRPSPYSRYPEVKRDSGI